MLLLDLGRTNGRLPIELEHTVSQTRAVKQFYALGLYVQLNLNNRENFTPEATSLEDQMDLTSGKISQWIQDFWISIIRVDVASSAGLPLYSVLATCTGGVVLQMAT